jgi:hypothetical protein
LPPHRYFSCPSDYHSDQNANSQTDFHTDPPIADAGSAFTDRASFADQIATDRDAASRDQATAHVTAGTDPAATTRTHHVSL